VGIDWGASVLKEMENDYGAAPEMFAELACKMVIGAIKTKDETNIKNFIAAQYEHGKKLISDGTSGILFDQICAKYPDCAVDYILSHPISCGDLARIIQKARADYPERFDKETRASIYEAIYWGIKFICDNDNGDVFELLDKYDVREISRDALEGMIFLAVNGGSSKNIKDGADKKIAQKVETYLSKNKKKPAKQADYDDGGGKGVIPMWIYGVFAALFIGGAALGFVMSGIIGDDSSGASPTARPTAAPTAAPTPVSAPIAGGTETTPAPTAEPTATPTAEPTATPTAQPTAAPIETPTPTEQPNNTGGGDETDGGGETEGGGEPGGETEGGEESNT
jgi:hypothetical protein